LKNINSIQKTFKASFERYQPNYKSKHWERYNLRSKLYKKSNLFNFRQNQLSSGLDDQNTIKNIKTYYFNLKKKIKEKFIIKNLLEKNIGNLNEFVFFFELSKNI
jgi:hypothetical protein